MKYKMLYTSPDSEESIVRRYESMCNAHIDVIDMLTFQILASYVVQTSDVADHMYHVLQDELVSLFETGDEDDQSILDHIYVHYNDMPFSSILNLYLRFTIIEGRKRLKELAPGFLLETSQRVCRFKVADAGVYEFIIEDDPESDIQCTLKDLVRKYGSTKILSVLDSMER